MCVCGGLDVVLGDCWDSPSSITVDLNRLILHVVISIANLSVFVAMLEWGGNRKIQNK